MLYATHALVRICYIALYSVDIEEEESIVKSLYVHDSLNYTLPCVQINFIRSILAQSLFYFGIHDYVREIRKSY